MFLDNIIRSLYTKTWSIDNIGKALKKNIHTNKSRKNCPKRKPKTYGLKKSNYVWGHGDSQDDVEVILPFRPKNHKTRRKISTIIKKDYNIRKTSSDLFGIKSSTCKSRYLCYQTCKHIGLHPFPKKRKKQSESKNHNLHRCCPLSNLKSTPKGKFKSEPEVSHFSLVNFPTCRKPRYAISSENVCKVDSGLSPLPPPLILNYSEDVDLNKLKIKPVICPNIISPNIYPECLKIPYEKEYCCSDKAQEPFGRRFLKILKCVSMNILQVVAVLVWLPCIVIASIVWAIIFCFLPLEPTRQDMPCVREYARKAVVCSKLWAINNYRRFCWLVRSGKNDVEITTQAHHHRPSISAMPCQVITARKKKTQKWQPNPTKRYVLYYDCKRGWLMKPERQRVQNTYRANVGSMKGKKVTFFDSISCTCEHTAEDKSVSECTEATCKHPVTKNPSCVKCSEKVVKVKVDTKKSQTETKKQQDVDPTEERLKLKRTSSAESLKLKRVSSAERLKLKRVPSAERLKLKRLPSEELLKLPRIPSEERLKLQRLSNKTKQKDNVVKRFPRMPAPRICCECGYTARAHRGRDIGKKTGKKAVKKAGKTIGKKTGKKTKNGNFGLGICSCLATCGREIWYGTKSADKETWGSGMEQCENMFWLTIKKKPCFWLRCFGDRAYLTFLGCHRHCMTVCRCCMFLCASCVWCPVFVCAYLCYTFVCMFCGNDCGCC